MTAIRILLFVFSIIIPIMFGWWIFLPLALLYVYLTKIPYEIIIAGFVLDSVYYFGEGLWRQFPLTIFGVFLILLAIFLSERIYWRKMI